MKADKPMKLVPKLRFPEFQDGDEWVVESLGSICNLYQPKPLSASAMQQDGPYIVYGANGVIGRHNRYNHKDCKVIVGCRGTCGEVHRTHPRSWITNNAMVVESKDNRIDENFIFYSLEGTDLSSLVTGGAQPQITCTGFSPFLFVFPECNEQQKIAACLGSLDNLIATESRKLEALREHKQGLMQQLFPQPGETVPRLRFPEFSELGAWKKTTIGNMGEVITGSTPSTSRKDFYGGDFMFVSPADISDSRFVEETKTTLTKEGFEKCRPIKKNSVLFVCIGSTIGKVAQCSRSCATNQQINSLMASPAYVADFAYYLLERESVRIARLAGKQAVPIINKNSFANVKVTVPMLDEQQRIADCLSSLYARLAIQVQKISALKTHKQGLLQKLFPSL